MCIQKQYYFVTKYFILKFTSATVLRIQGSRVEFKIFKRRTVKLVFQRDSEISYLGEMTVHKSKLRMDDLKITYLTFE